MVRHASLPLIMGLAVCTTLGAGAQTTFLRMYNKGNTGYSVREVPGNNYVVVGGTDYYYNWSSQQLSPLNTSGIHLFETALNGTLIWQKSYTMPGSRLIARWMEPTPDGGFIVAGMGGTDRLWPPDSNDVVLVKTDAMGIIDWARAFDSGKDDLGFCVRPTSDGGFIISGFHDPAPITVAINTYALLIKTDGSGNVQWINRYAIPCRDENTHEAFPVVVCQLSDGGYAVTGATTSAHPADLFVFRTDASGTLIWANSYDHDASAFRSSTGLDIFEHTDGDLIIAGSMDKSNPNERNYPYVLRISGIGAVIDANFYETVPLLLFQSGFSSVAPQPGGGFFFTGMGGYSGFGQQAQLLKTDEDLDMIWSRVYTWDGVATMGARSGRPTSDGGYIFTGKRQFTGSVLMKTDAVGLIACKNPNVLIPNTPDLVVQNKVPLVAPMTMGAGIAPLTTVLLADTTVLCPTSFSTLPVELGDFTVTALDNGHVLNQWTTFSEQDNDRFEIEKSLDAITYTLAGTVMGAGSSASAIHYSFEDASPLPAPVSYYRLKQVDRDGVITYSDAIAVTFAGDRLALAGSSVDPATGDVVLHVIAPHDLALTCRLMDMHGRLVRTGSFAVHRGVNELRIHADGLAGGIHAVTLTSAAGSITGRIVH